MVLELHVWGPAFGLPSIDPVCIASVAYLNRTVPRDQWILVADHDTSLSPRGEFPLLVDAGKTIVGFTNIISHLRDHYPNAYNLDGAFTQKQQTDRVAFMSFLEATAGPLVDLYLFVSSENYKTTTTTAYTAILPWFSNYTIPPARRELAKARTAHLGLSSLDVTEASEGNHGPGRGTSSSEYETAKRSAGIPGSDRTSALHMGRGRGLLSSPVYAARFRLDALSNELLQPLSDQLGSKEYMFGGSEPSSLDCLALGYLSLLRYAPVPQAWVKETLQTRFPTLDAYIVRLRTDLLQEEDIKAADIWAVTTGRAAANDTHTHLPWAGRSSRAILPQLLEAVHHAAMPQVLQSSAKIRHDGYERDGRSEGPTTALLSSFTTNTIATVASTVAVGLTALAVHHRKTPREGPLIFWALRPLQPVLESFGVDSFLKHL